jgi:lipid A ethanolaminephosphotransferase
MPTSTSPQRLDRSHELARRAPSLPELLIQSDAETAGALWRGLRRFWTGFALPEPVSFALVVSLIWATFYNAEFWRLTVEAMWHGVASVAFLGTLVVVAVTVQATLLLLLPSRWLKVVVGCLFIVAAASSYFCSEYGAIINQDMLRNVVETDAAEVRGLITADFIAHLLVFGVLPALIVFRGRMPASGWKAQLKRRGGVLAVAWVCVVVGVFATSANYAVFFRQHKPIRYTLVPVAPLSSTIALVGSNFRHSHEGPLLNPGGAVQRVGVASSRPLLVFLVVGETARAKNFQLGGYDRATNPRLKEIPGLVYFDRATSCGTSTAVSVPCMFSVFGRSHFDVGKSGAYLNLLDTLAGAGVDVEWRDNNAGCKGVCSRAPSTQYGPSTKSAYCVNSYCFDEVMLEDLSQRVDAIRRDTVIVFHQIGSHGPAYSERYPPAFEIFKPVCRSSELQRCTVEEVRNAYDNSIAYTDYVLSRQIEILRQASDRFDTMLLYASDHGESLGEHGVYLHGMPYAFAPEDQKRVPFIMWTSSAFRNRMGVDDRCLHNRSHGEVSHDNLYHTLLSVAGLSNQVYDPKLDLLQACRSVAS